MTRALGTSLTSAGLLLAATLVVPSPAPAVSPPAGTHPDRVRLTAPPGEVVRSARVDLGGPLGQDRGPARTTSFRSNGFSMVAATWRGADPRIEVRALGRDGRTGWRSLPPLVDGPRLPGDRGASDLLWVDGSTTVRVRTRGPLPEALHLVLIDPGRLPGDAAAAAPEVPRLLRPLSAPRPTLHSRKEWGADPDWRNGKPHYLDHLKQIHVHHTATGNGYSRSDVPGILRGIYRYHTKTLGWFDIGYNFLVDRFGRAWVGRSGGANQLVRGAHTLGFNHSSVGIAMLGNLQDRRPWTDAVTTLVKLAAWKLDKYGRDAQDRVTVTSSGSDKYADGEEVRLPAIDGHRDTNDTACPGDRLYGRLPEIRRRAQWRIDNW